MAARAGPSGIWGLVGMIEKSVQKRCVRGTESAVAGKSEQSFFRQMRGKRSIHTLVVNLKEKLDYADQRSSRQPAQEILLCKMSF